MKRKLFVSALFALFAVGATSQNTDPRIEEILKEKLRTVAPATEDPVLSDANKTTANGEIKISNNNLNGIQESEGFIAINPTDSNKMVLSFMEFTPQGLAFPVYTSNDAGQTWSKSSFDAAATINSDFPTNNLQIAGGGDPVFAYDSDGKLYFSWIYLLFDQTNNVAYFAMYWASSTNNGASFQLATGDNRFVGKGALNVFTGNVSNDYGDGVLDRQWHAVDRTGGTFDGRLYATGLFIPNDSTTLSGDGLILKWKDKNASAFDTIQTQISATGDAQFGNVVVDGNGNVHITFADLGDNNIYHRVSTDGGATFAPQTKIYDGTALFGNNGGHIIHDRENSAPNLVVAPNNTLHLVWSDYVAGTVVAYYSRSTNQGTTWSTPIELGTFLDGKTAHNMMPVVAVNNANNPSISWYGVKSNKQSIFYNVQSVDGGASFLAPTAVSTDSTNYAQYGQSDFFGDYCNAVKTDCKTFALWSDGRNNSGPKMYVGVVDHCASIGIQELTPLGAGIALNEFYPNPVKNQLNLNIDCDKDFKAEIKIMSTTGAVVWQQKEALQSGENLLSYPLNLASGNYILNIETATGDRIVRKLSVVNE